MDICGKCDLSVPRVYSCSHCTLELCFTDFVAHAKEVSLNYVRIPAMIAELAKSDKIEAAK